MITWQWFSFDELNNHDLYDLMALREKTFTFEQHCTEIDFDYQDQEALHLLGRDHDHLIAYLRLLPRPKDYPGAITFGRVVVPSEKRGQGYAKAMMNEVLSYLEKHYSSMPIIISAQRYLEKFYGDFGFKTLSKPYQEAGIEHVKMKKL
jgi:ElaA protein